MRARPRLLLPSPGPHCPECGEALPGKLLVAGLGKPFTCKRCGEALVVPKGHGLSVVIAGLLGFFLLEQQVANPLLLSLALMLIVGGVSWLTMRARRV